MISRWILPLILSLIQNSFAVFADEAYATDFHHALIGLPQASTTFFHTPWAASKAALIYTLSEKNVLAAVNPKDGSIVWRQLLTGNEEQTSHLKRVEGGDVVVAVAAGAVSAWSAADGKLAWDYTPTYAAQVVDVEVPDMVTSAEASTAKDAVVLLASPNAVVQRLDGTNGQPRWTYEDSTADVPLRVSASATSIFVITYHKTRLSGLKLKVTKLDPVTGKSVGEHVLSSESEVSGPEDIVFVGSNSASHMLAWTDPMHSVLKINILATNKISSFNIRADKGKVEQVQIYAANKNHAYPHFLVHYQSVDSHWAEVYHIDLKSTALNKAYDLPALSGRGVFSVTTVDANVFFMRITEEDMLLVSSTSHGILGKWALKGLRVPGLLEHVYPLHAVSDVVARDASTYAVRSAILLSNGDWVLMRNGEKDWVRTESLAGVIKAVWVPPATDPELQEVLEAEAHSNPINAYVHRVNRHIREFSVIKLLLNSISQLVLTKTPSFGIKSDLTAAQKAFFGFDKLLVAATDNGRVVAIEAGNRGRIAWNCKAVDLPKGSKWTASAAGPVLTKLMATRGPLLEATTQTPNFATYEKLLGEASQNAADHSENLPADAITYSIEGGLLLGHKGSTRVWQFSPPRDQMLSGISAPLENEQIALIGKVLNDRTVLYKYLNPNTILVTGVNEARRQLSIYLLDAVSGTVLFTATHGHVDTSRPITSAVTENWFAYAFAADSISDTASKGYQLVFNELLESSIPNDRGILAAAMNSSSINPASQGSHPVALSQTYHIPEEIAAMGVTQTLQGITSRELLVSLAGSNSIVGIPGAALDPRRVVGKDPTRAQLEEGLSRYMPMLDFDPKWYLNHKQEVIGIKKIVATPALLESTSLVFAYGHDLFGTRIAPSFAFDVLGNSFNKVSLVLTVAALTAAAFFVAPLIQRKQTNMLWTNI